MKRRNALVNFIIPYILFLLFSSCREDIIPPDSPGNINDPLLTITNNSYSFTINASDMNTTLINHTSLQSSRTRVYSFVTNHISGYVEVKVQTADNRTVFSKVFTDDAAGTFDEIEGHRPEIVVFEFNNFTGMLRLQLTRID